jgi:hypothetical protein
VKNTWAEFVAKVRTLAAGDYEIANLGDWMIAQIRQGVIDIQEHIPSYRIGHTTILKPCDLTTIQNASRGCLNHATDNVRKVEIVTGGDDCQRRLVWMEPWHDRQNIICGCRTASDFAGITFDVGRGEFYVQPVIPDGYYLEIEWEGLKKVFDDADCVPFDEQMAGVVRDYLAWKIKKEIDHDLASARVLEIDYFKSRLSLYRNARTRKRLTDDIYNRSKDNCVKCWEIAPCTEVESDTDHKVVFVAFGDSGMTSSGAETVVASPTYPYANITVPNYYAEIQQAVADLTDAIAPDFLLLLGDLNYPSGSKDTLEENLIDYFEDYIPNAQGFKDGDLTATTVASGYTVLDETTGGKSAYPAWGNHDLGTAEDGMHGGPLMALFPEVYALNDGNRYYDFVKGHAHFFVLNSDESETAGKEEDGIDISSAQYQWFTEAVAASTAAWKIVIVHRPPYTTDDAHQFGSEKMRWPFDMHGIDLVLSGHAHGYERFSLDYTLINVGTGGAPLRNFGPRYSEVKYRYNKRHGVLKGEICEDKIKLEFWNIDHKKIDCITLKKECENE